MAIAAPTTRWNTPLYVASSLSLLFLLALLSPFVPLGVLLAPLGVIGLFTVIYRWPAGVIAAAALVAPFQPLPTLALHAAGYGWVTAVSSAKEIGMVLATIVLLWRHGIKWKAVDYILLALVAWVVLISVLLPNFSPIGVKDDLDFVIPFFAGRALYRVHALNWAKVGLWTAALVSALGAFEFFVLGIGPRLLLLGLSDPADLPASFRADQFSGYRAASTLASPLEFAGLCAVILLVFATYHRQLPRKYWIAALVIALGLVLSITRMAWLAAFLGLAFIAVKTGQVKKLMLIGALSGVIVLAVLLPRLGLSDFLASTVRGQDTSLRGHEQSLTDKFDYVLSHPFGSGAGTVGVRAEARNPTAQHVESVYLQLGMEYGWPALLLSILFAGSACATLAWHRSPAAIAGTAVALAMVTMYAFSTLHLEFPVNAWGWLIVGIALSHSQHFDDRSYSQAAV